jgi:polyhydroxybutyrate depolymerase
MVVPVTLCRGTMHMATTTLTRSLATLALALWSLVANAAYVAENRSIVSGGVTRTFVLARPSPLPGGALPLVFSLHGDGGTGAGMRAALPLEAQTANGAVFVYPNAADGSTFEYYTYAGRTAEAQFVQAVIAALAAEFGIDTQRVYVAGFSGGATMANALGCRLGPGVVRGLAIHSGTLYPVEDGLGNPDFTYTGNGGVSCPLPATIMIWGQADNVPGVSYGEGLGVRDNYRATQNCAATSQAALVSPCIRYDGCLRELDWCSIPGMGHQIWGSAAQAIWLFISASGTTPGVLFANGFE